MMTKPNANMMKIASTMFASNSIMDFISPEASATDATEATVLFFVNAIRVLPSGGNGAA